MTKTILEIRLGSVRQQRQQYFDDVLSRRRMCFHPNHIEMFGQRQHHPVAKMFVQRNQRSFFLHRAFEDQRVLGPCLSDFRGADDVRPTRPQQVRQLRPQHLVEVEPHGGSGRLQGGKFSVQHRLAGVIQCGLNVGTGQFRISAQEGIPRFGVGQLFQNGCHRNPRPFDRRMAAANPRINRNSVIHDANFISLS